MVRTTRCSVFEPWREGARLVNRPIALFVAGWLMTGGLSLAGQARTEKDAPAERILALDPRWGLTFETAPAAAAGFDQQMAYVPLKDGELLAISLDEGALRWKVALATAFAPATGDGLVFAGGDAGVVALDQRTGQAVWRLELGSALNRPLYWDSGLVLAATESGELVAIRAEDGQIVWRTTIQSPIASTPVASDERLYLALHDGSLLALSLATGVTGWTYPLN